MAANSSSSFSFNSLLLLPVFLLALSSLILHATADTASDFKECSTQLIEMQTCITYVQGTAKSPTPDCCTGLKDVLVKSPKCLCILVKDHDDPQLPIKINVTRALALPAACSTSANISSCPQLLNLPPNSTEAEIFKQGGSSAQVSPSPNTAQEHSKIPCAAYLSHVASNSSVNTSTGTSPNSTPESSDSGSSNHWPWKGWVVRETVAGGCLLCFVMHLLLLST